MSIEFCHGCGWEVSGGFAGCKSRFEQYIARDFEDVLYGRTHRLLVDTYCLQHPDEYCASAKSFAAHLAGICWILEEGASPAVGPHELHRWLNGEARIQRPEAPGNRGKLTIGDLPSTASASEWQEHVHEWARSTWQAYASLHQLAHEWIGLARSA
jgi:hypothetical protein